MRYLAIFIVLAAIPLFMGLLSSPRHRRWAFVGLGALPILYLPLNLDASFISWPTWPGHTRGLSFTIVDSLALAIVLRSASKHPIPPLLWAFVFYLVCLLPSLLSGGQFQPAIFVVFQAMRVTLFFYAVYLAMLSGQTMRIAEGLAYAVIASGAMSVYHGLSGVVQAPGILGHQNLSGLATNLCIPLLLALGLSTRRWLFLAAVAAGAMGAVAGGSRATMVFFGLSVACTLLATVIVKPNGRTLAIAGVAALGLVAAAPLVVQKLNERHVAGFEKDPERVAFEKTAELMIADYPWGVGLNQYVSVANLGGYFDKGGVRWGFGARSTNVHNTYLLMRAEAGMLGLVGLLVWLFSPIVMAASALFRRKMPLREASIAGGIAIASAALHAQYEWVLVTASPEYLLALMAGVVAAVSANAVHTKRARTAVNTAHASPAAVHPSSPKPVGR